MLENVGGDTAVVWLEWELVVLDAARPGSAMHSPGLGHPMYPLRNGGPFLLITTSHRQEMAGAGEGRCSLKAKAGASPCILHTFLLVKSSDGGIL
jgi:hypothetical protein